MHQLFFYLGIAWLAVLIGICVVLVARTRSTASRILLLDLVILVLIGLLGLVAGEDQQPFALDAALALALLSFVATLAAARYYGARGPFA